MTTDDNNKLIGIITKGIGGIYTVRLDNGSFEESMIRGGIRSKKITPAIGDRVVLEPSGDPDIKYVISKIMDRSSYLVRPTVANLDCLLLTFAVKDPEPDLKLLDKLLVISAVINVEPVIIFTKCDLDSENALKLFEVYKNAGFKCLMSHGDTMPDEDELVKLTGKKAFSGFAGPSGVGKSTLCNHFLDDSKMTVGDISERLKRGKHTTRHVELFEFSDGFLSDTPGFTSLSLEELGIDYRQVRLGFPEIIRLSEDCKYSDCRHRSIKDCAVSASVGQPNGVDAGRLERFRELEGELYDNRNNFSGRKRYT